MKGELCNLQADFEQAGKAISAEVRQGTATTTTVVAHTAIALAELTNAG